MPFWKRPWPFVPDVKCINCVFWIESCHSKEIDACFSSVVSAECSAGHDKVCCLEPLEFGFLMKTTENATQTIWGEKNLKWSEIELGAENNLVPWGVNRVFPPLISFWWHRAWFWCFPMLDCSSMDHIKLIIRSLLSHPSTPAMRGTRKWTNDRPRAERPPWLCQHQVSSVQQEHCRRWYSNGGGNSTLGCLYTWWSDWLPFFQNRNDCFFRTPLLHSVLPNIWPTH